MEESFQPITLTPRANLEAKKLSAADPSQSEKFLRLYIEGKGCDGFTYGVTFDTPNESDLHFPHDEISVIVDQDTIFFTHGSSIDWVDDHRGKGFLVLNPRHRKFRGKFFRKPNWRKATTQSKGPKH